ncbi:MAG: MTH938/NDUFAF3 family protein [Burkholderiales bacterium]|nr:MTH938/NDUFAF3 family protein [Burkholderiales bacterium]
MKLQTLIDLSQNTLTGYGPGFLEINRTRHSGAVLVAPGARQRFAHPRLYASLSAARIGLEMMDTGAACRTYNILMAEGRKVLAALIPPTP